MLYTYYTAGKKNQLNKLNQAFEALNLNAPNNPIVWEYSNEYSSIANQYNRLVEKLENNNFAISQKEKSQAWAEIAKQVAHEIKNPLTPMTLNLQHMQRNLEAGNMPSQEQLNKRIEGLLIGLQEIAAISDSFATFAKMPIPALNSTNLFKIYQQVSALYLAENSLHFTHNLKTISIVKADETQLMQIINNLIINALQACHNTVNPKIELDFYKEKQQYHIKVMDNGTGIDSEIIDKIFLPNFSTKAMGSGVGLAFARWAIENFNGQIKAENNTYGPGATFTIYLPAFN
jgi:two-component system, NtrC family, nitrogen regulation sensor histidine kinase NtrY